MGIELQIQQKLNLSQRMIQSVQILQMTTQELDTYIDELALENPTIEVERPAGESFDAFQQVYMAGEEEHYLQQRQRDDDEYDPKDSWNFNTDQGETLRDHLWSQLDLKSFTKTQVLVLYFLLDNLDEKGYLTETSAFVAEHFDLEEQEVEDMVQVLQQLEPAGVCARSLSECLQIQMGRQNVLNDDLKQITENYLDLVAKNKIAALAEKLSVAPAKASGYCALIRTLDPKPGGRFYHQEEVQYIIPDVYVIPDGDRFSVSLNRDGSPTIFVNSYYQRLYKATADREVKDYLDKKIRQTDWLKQCIMQRQDTLTKVSNEIVEKQIAFFQKGPGHLKPLTMQEVAEAVGIHESTVSRAVSQKYLQCTWGIFPMDRFFQRTAVSGKKAGGSDDDKGRTSESIKQAIKEILGSENPKKPYSDRILSEKLEEMGIHVSRRTVAKYRDEEGIPDASGRKQY